MLHRQATLAAIEALSGAVAFILIHYTVLYRLGAASYGSYVVLTAGAALLSGPAPALNLASYSLVSRNPDSKTVARSVLKNALFSAVSWTLLASVFLLAIGDTLHPDLEIHFSGHDFTPSKSLITVALVLSLVLTASCDEVLLGVVRGLGAFGANASLQISVRSVQVVAVLLAQKHFDSVHLWLLFNAAFALAALLARAFLVFSIQGRSRSEVGESISLTAFLSESARTVVVSSAQVASLNVDRIIVGQTSGHEAAAVYNLFNQVTQISYLMVLASQQVLRHPQGDKSGATSVRRSLYIVGLAALLAALGFWVMVVAVNILQPGLVQGMSLVPDYFIVILTAGIAATTAGPHWSLLLRGNSIKLAGAYVVAILVFAFVSTSLSGHLTSPLGALLARLLSYAGQAICMWGLLRTYGRS